MMVGMADIVIDSRVHVRLDSIPEGCVRKLQERFTYSNPDYAKAAARNRWGKVSSRIPETLETWAFSEDMTSMSFSRGALEQVLSILECPSASYSMRTTEGSESLIAELKRNPFVHGKELRPFQREQVQAGLENTTCLWRAPAGSGKTTASLAYIAKLNLPALVVVPSMKVFEQWLRRAEEEFGLREDQIGVLQGSTRRVQPLTIAMQQTLRNCADQYANMFGVYVADEVQRHGADTFFHVTDCIPARYRLGVSADERRADGKEFLIYDLFGPTRHQVKRDMLVEQGFIHDAEVRVIPTDFRADWYKRLKPRNRAMGNVQSKLSLELAKDEKRNELLRQVIRWCVDSGEQTLLLAWRVEHCHILNSIAASVGVQCGLMLGGKDQEEEFERSRLAMEAGELQVASGTYQAIGVGFDLPSLGRGVMAAPCANSEKGSMQFGQFCGRFERISFGTGKSGAVIYYLWDREVFGERPLRNLMKWKKNVVVLSRESGVFVPAKEYLKKPPVEVRADAVDELFSFED